MLAITGPPGNGSKEFPRTKLLTWTSVRKVSEMPTYRQLSARILSEWPTIRSAGHSGYQHQGHATDHSLPRGHPHREVSFRRRCSLAFISSLTVRRWTYLDESTPQPQSRTLGNELDCVIQISRFQHLNSTQLLLRFRVRTVCHRNLSVLPRHGHRRVGGLKRFHGDQMSVLPKFVVVAEALVEHGVALALRHVFELARLEIAQTDVYHCPSRSYFAIITPDFVASLLASFMVTGWHALPNSFLPLPSMTGQMRRLRPSRRFASRSGV